MIKDGRVSKTAFPSIQRFERKIITSKNRLCFGPPHFENRVAGPAIPLIVPTSTGKEGGIDSS